VERPSSWYLDLNLLSRYVRSGAEGGRVYHHTAPVTMIAALHAGLGAILDEGIDAARAAAMPSAGSSAGRPRGAGVETLRRGGPSTAPADHGGDTGPLPERAWARRTVRRLLLTRYGIEIGREPGSWRARCGASAAWATRRADETSWRLLGALKEVLDR
jgi:alanine-glyoxylate transaminase/serine-glyoxylate transaminase/serine-pyruvate transaminase